MLKKKSRQAATFLYCIIFFLGLAGNLMFCYIVCTSAGISLSVLYFYFPLYFYLYLPLFLNLYLYFVCTFAFFSRLCRYPLLVPEREGTQNLWVGSKVLNFLVKTCFNFNIAYLAMLVFHEKCPEPLGWVGGCCLAEPTCL